MLAFIGLLTAALMGGQAPARPERPPNAGVLPGEERSDRTSDEAIAKRFRPFTKKSSTPPATSSPKAGVFPGEEKIDRASDKAIPKSTIRDAYPATSGRVEQKMSDGIDESRLVAHFQTKDLTPKLLNVIARDSFEAKVDRIIGTRWAGRATPETLVRLVQLEIVPGKVISTTSSSPIKEDSPSARLPQLVPFSIEVFTAPTASLLLRRRFNDVTFVAFTKDGKASAVVSPALEQEMRTLGFFGGRLYAAPPPGTGSSNETGGIRRTTESENQKLFKEIKR